MDEHLLTQALARARELYGEHAATMRQLAETGGNPLVTAQAASALGREFDGYVSRLGELLPASRRPMASYSSNPSSDRREKSAEVRPQP